MKFSFDRFGLRSYLLGQLYTPADVLIVERYVPSTALHLKANMTQNKTIKENELISPRQLSLMYEIFENTFPKYRSA